MSNQLCYHLYYVKRLHIDRNYLKTTNSSQLPQISSSQDDKKYVETAIKKVKVARHSNFILTVLKKRH